MTYQGFVKLFVAAGLSGVVSAAAAVAGAAGPEPQVRAQAGASPLSESFYRSLTGILNTGGALPNQAGTIFSLEPASLVIDPFITHEDGADLNALAALADRLTLGQPMREDAGITFSTLYRDILKFARLPEQTPGPPTEEQRAAFRLLYVDGERAKGLTPLFARYTNLKQALDALLKEAETGSSPAMAARIAAARQRLEVMGRQHEVESALSRIRQAGQSNAVEAAAARFEEFLRSPQSPADSSSPQVRTLPALASWDDDGGWTRLNFAIQADPSVRETVAVPAQLAVSLEIKRVLIDRRWVDANLLAAPWVWKAETPSAVRGLLPRPPAADGRPRPCLTTQLILARNVALSGWSGSSARQVHAVIRKASQLAIGPITLKGPYGLPAGSSTFSPRPRSTGVFSPELHLIGRVCQVL